MRVVDVGAARLTILNVGDLNFSLRDIIDVPESEWRPQYEDLFQRKLEFPTQNILVSIEGADILVDAGEYAKFASEGSDYVGQGYVPPPGLVQQLEMIGAPVNRVGHVVITHAHYDHYAGVTTDRGGGLVPTFPIARHYLGRGDWDWPEMRKPLADQSSNEAKTFGILNKMGALELVSGVRELVPGVSILPAPGESPGHQVLRVQSEGQTAYCVGDLFHHRVEVENPKWMASWCDGPGNIKTREAFIESALREDAVVVPAHMPPGRILRQGSGATYLEMPGP